MSDRIDFNRPIVPFTPRAINPALAQVGAKHYQMGPCFIIVTREPRQQGAAGIVRQCKAAGVPVFVKQIGSQPRGWCAWNAPEHVGSDEAARLLAAGDDGDCVNWEASEQQHPCNSYGVRCVMLADRAGADPSEWPADLRVQEWPR